MESMARGRTKWKRFAVVMVPSVAATAAIGVALGQGALAASFSVSGQQFKVAAERLDGTGFVQYGALDTKHNGEKVPVAVSAFDTATIKNLCQSVVLPVPGFGDVSLNLGAGGGKDPVEAKNLYIDLDTLSADATFTNIDIGTAVGSTTKGPGVKKGDAALPGSFSQQAETAVLTDVKQTAWATTAGTFKLSGLNMKVLKGKHECY
ncbi:DUF6230 family protein [Streptomyces thermolineatus]|uniref:DUF6230 family protein n=1 Tax=Streptomyces thermolineatus TaxID=44033 RepID=A0ABP5Y340_9ACTN